jgi:hypothetical protein
VGGHPDLPTGGDDSEAIARGDAASREDRHFPDTSQVTEPRILGARFLCEPVLSRPLGAQCSGPQVLVKVERPQRSEDERP